MAGGKAVGQIGQIVDQHGDQHEEDHAEAAVFQKALPAERAALRITQIAQITARPAPA